MGSNPVGALVFQMLPGQQLKFQRNHKVKETKMKNKKEKQAMLFNRTRALLKKYPTKEFQLTDIASRIGYSTDSIRRELNLLRAMGEVTQKRTYIRGRPYIYIRWCSEK
jgi:response regulator of citrate/malate metabolism